jgi:hypothetical protein
LSLDSRSRRALLASLLLVAVVLAASAVPFFHNAGNETEGHCIACRLTLQAVAIHVPLLDASIGLLPLGAVAIAGPSTPTDGDPRPASSRGPPLA